MSDNGTGQDVAVDGIDGESITGRESRRERARRGVIGGVVVLVVAALAVVVGMAASGQLALPGGSLRGSGASEGAAPSEGSPEEEQRTLDVIRELPTEWEVQEYQGLRFAVPGEWVESDASRAPSTVVLADEAGAGWLGLHATTSTQDPDDEFGYGYVFDPPSGADRAGAELDQGNETLHAWIEVRRAGGRTYSMDVLVPAGEDGERIVRTIAGNVEFTAEADHLPAYADLEDAQPLLDGTPEAPEDWVEAGAQGFRLKVPPEWDDVGDEFEVIRYAAGDAQPEGGMQAWIEEPGLPGEGEIHVGAYRLDIPDVGQAVIRLNDAPHLPARLGETRSSEFSAHAEVRLADNTYLWVTSHGPTGPGSAERFWQMLGSLELVAD